MKKVLLGTSALLLTTSIAWAEVSVGGDGRMGIVGGGTDDTATVGVDETDLNFTSRIRISFSASGETDAGLQFGGSIRADNAGGGNSGTAGSVFVSGTFGKISMGDVAGAPEAAVGDLSGVGLTGLGDFNEFFYLSNNPDLTTALTLATTTDAARPAARWDYTTGDLGIHVSADNPGGDTDAYGIAVTYAMGNISFGLGHEVMNAPGADLDHTIAGVSAGFGDATVKAIYGTADLDGTVGDDFEQYGVSLDFVSGATTFTAYYRTVDIDGTSGDIYGVGVAYDLGGGASLVAGYVDGDDVNPLTTGTFGSSLSDPSYDFGINMSF